MSTAEPTVFVIDDDAAVRQSLSLLVRSMSLNVEVFDSAASFLDLYDRERPGCLVLDIRMPGMGGLELQQELEQRNVQLPIIFITGHGDVSMAVRAMRAGAIDFLEKPFNDQDLLARINQALEVDFQWRQTRDQLDTMRARLRALTPRESDVMERIVKGQANKVVAIELGLSERTVEIHRAKVMAKTGSKSLAELVATITKLEGS